MKAETIFSCGGWRLAMILVLGSAPSLLAANLLVNPGFELNSGRQIPSGWTRFAPPGAAANYWIEGPAQAGVLSWKQWGALYNASVTNVAGIYQEFSSAPGSIYQAGGWFYTKTSDTIGANNRAWIEVAFLGTTSNLLALYKTEDFTADSPKDTWTWLPVNQAADIGAVVPSGDPYFTTYAVTGTVSQLTAPAGTKSVVLRYAYSQAGTSGGSANVDSVVLDQVSGPVPPVISNVLPLNMIFANPNEGFTFTVTSPSGFTIENSAIELVVNGTNVTSGLVISGGPSSKNVAWYGLQSNQTYTVSVSVTDSAGFSASTSTSFQTTWAGLPAVSYLWEAEDFDFEGGKYINNPELCTSAGNPNCYFGKAGINGVDYQSLIPGTTRLYRPDDPIPTTISGDWSRKPLVLAGRSDYRIDPFIGGEWLNYTRDWSNGVYWISARLATGENLSGALSLGLVNEDTSVTELGKFTIESGLGWSTYQNVMLRDTNGNIVNVPLDGKATLRVTSEGNLLPNFFMLSPAQLDLPLLSKLYPTGERPFEHTNRLSFSVQTVGATFPAGGIQVFLDGVNVSSNLVITGTDSTKDVVYPNLPENAIHTAVILVTNSLGNGLSLTNQFDTFSLSNFTFEAEDFNYDGGQFVPEWFPSIYSGYGAVTNVDFQHSPIEGEQYPYRPEGIPQEIARDYIRESFIIWGGTDYHLAWYGGGDWANYTRLFPTNHFFIYARSGGFGEFQMALDKVDGASSTNQSLNRLGYWLGNGRDNQTHEWIALTDLGGAPVPVMLSGETTLRVSTSTGNAHPSFFMLVPAVGLTLSAQRAPEGVAISFPTQNGVVYRVLYRNQVHAGDWNLLKTVVGDGTVQSVTDAIDGTRFYKVVAP